MTITKKALFDEALKHWISVTWLGWWKIDVVYLSTFDMLQGDSDNTIDTVATCETNWKYMEATITVHEEKLERVKDSEIADLVLHELMHVVLNEMREDGIDHEERVATFLARSMHAVEQKARQENRVNVHLDTEFLRGLSYLSEEELKAIAKTVERKKQKNTIEGTGLGDDNERSYEN